MKQLNIKFKHTTFFMMMFFMLSLMLTSCEKEDIIKSEKISNMYLYAISK